MAVSYSLALRSARMDEVTAAIGNAGLINIYDGTRPSTGGTATNLLAQLTGGTPFAPAASNGVLTANSITADSSANQSGTATWGRITTSGGTFVMDFNVGTSGSDLNLTTTTIVATQPVSISSFVLTEGNS